MFFFQAADRRFGFNPTRFERRTFFLGPPPLERDRIALSRQPRRIVAGPRELRLMADNRFS